MNCEYYLTSKNLFQNIVDESLFGKDPDVAEDLTNANDTAAISRRRQRNEICVTLKRSSVIHHVYIAKNVFEVILVLLYLPLNIFNALDEFDISAPCHVDLQSIPGIQDKNGTVHFVCRGKKMNFYGFLLWAQIVLLAIYGVCSLFGVIWCLYFR